MNTITSFKNQNNSYIPELIEQLNSDYSSHNQYDFPDKIRFIDLFAGIGGMRLGFSRFNSECVFSSEWDKYAQITYEANFHEKPFGDIHSISVNDVPKHDILLAGFPCQPFSTIGKREGFQHLTQGNLFSNIANILAAKKPFCFLLENVPGLVTHNQGKTWQTILKTLDFLGYDVRYSILDAALFDLPQVRERIYLVGFYRQYLHQRVNFLFPLGQENDVFIDRFIESNLTGYSISKHLQDTYLFKKPDGRPQIVDNQSKVKVKTFVSTYHKIQRLTGTFVRDGETGLRLLSKNECKSLMGFPDNFTFPVSRTQMYRQLGNSVAIPVLKSIADNIYKTFINCAIPVGSGGNGEHLTPYS
ncbi:MAG: DNA (cytosine-5-)-methyltransferase [Gloeocapsa sp. DLM2.Bin57]|nr:MAG: DNA (cytosine-5-)-methyltransferase [Gloeocapsa sp. DLM2.Bin57]